MYGHSPGGSATPARLLCRTAWACFSLSLKPITPSTEKNQINLSLFLDNDPRMRAEFQGSYPSSSGAMHAEKREIGQEWQETFVDAEQQRKKNQKKPQTAVEKKTFFFS